MILSNISNIARDRGLRFVAVVQFITMMAIGIYASGCAASVQTAQLDRIEQKVDSIDTRVARLEALPPGTQVVDFVDTQDRSVDTAYLPVAAPAVNHGTCRFVVDGNIVDTQVQANELAKSLKVPSDKIGTSCFKKDRLDLGSLASRDLQIGQ
ncbi:hypothetical protein KBC59_03720 [Patescibacteria group bacterium]|nr:hypothetical protein [Patescibacteria group bacterium]